MMEEIDRFCCDEKQLVTYQWLSRKLNVASDTSKRLLAQYAQTKGDKVQPLFFVSGRAKGGGGTHSIKIVGGTEVDATKALFEQVSSVHVYSVQVKVPADPTDLFQVDHASRKDEFEQPPGISNALRDNRWSRTQFEFVRTERSAAPGIVASTTETAPQPKVEPSRRSAAAPSGTKKSSMFPQMAAKSSKLKAPAQASQAPATSKTKPPKKGQTALGNFFKTSAKKVPADPAKPNAPPAAASLDTNAGRGNDFEEEEDDDDDDAGQAAQLSKRGKTGQNKRRRVAYISSDSEDEEDEETAAREQAEAEERLRQREAAAEEEERRAAEATAQEESRKRPVYSEDEEEDEEEEEEQGAQNEQRQEEAAAGAAAQQGTISGKRVIRKKRSRTFMNDKGFITTEEFWEETEVDENGVEGETRVVDGPAESASAKPASAKPAKLQAAAKKRSGQSSSEREPEAESKPKKKSKKAAGTRDIMSFFGKK